MASFSLIHFAFSYLYREKMLRFRRDEYLRTISLRCVSKLQWNKFKKNVI